MAEKRYVPNKYTPVSKPPHPLIPTFIDLRGNPLQGSALSEIQDVLNSSPENFINLNHHHANYAMARARHRLERDGVPEEEIEDAAIFFSLRVAEGHDGEGRNVQFFLKTSLREVGFEDKETQLLELEIFRNRIAGRGVPIKEKKPRTEVIMPRKVLKCTFDRLKKMIQENNSTQAGGTTHVADVFRLMDDVIAAHGNLADGNPQQGEQ